MLLESLFLWFSGGDNIGIACLDTDGSLQSPDLAHTHTHLALSTIPYHTNTEIPFCDIHTYIHAVGTRGDIDPFIAIGEHTHAHT